MRIGRRVYKDLAVKPRRQKSSIAGASRHPTSTPTCAIGRRVYKDLAIIGFSMNQPQNLSLIHIERDTPNEKHHPSNKAPIAGAPRHPTSTPIGAIRRRVHQDLAVIGFSINQPQNSSLIRIDHAIANEKHTRARDGSIRAIKSPIASAASHPTSTPTGAIGRRVYQDLAFKNLALHAPATHPSE